MKASCGLSGCMHSECLLLILHKGIKMTNSSLVLCAPPTANAVSIRIAACLNACKNYGCYDRCCPEIHQVFQVFFRDVQTRVFRERSSRNETRQQWWGRLRVLRWLFCRIGAGSVAVKKIGAKCQMKRAGAIRWIAREGVRRAASRIEPDDDGDQTRELAARKRKITPWKLRKLGARRPLFLIRFPALRPDSFWPVPDSV